MATCEACGQEMLLGTGCSHTIMVLAVDGGGEEQRERVRYGQEKEDWGAGDGLPCHDCAVKPGGCHHPGCDVERCPRCGAQAIGCEHSLATRADVGEASR
jgi:hypothetical protein